MLQKIQNMRAAVGVVFRTGWSKSGTFHLSAFACVFITMLVKCSLILNDIDPVFSTFMQLSFHLLSNFPISCFRIPYVYFTHPYHGYVTTVRFLTIRFSVSHLFSRSLKVKQFYLIQRSIPWQSGPGSDENEGVLHISQSPKTKASLLVWCHTKGTSSIWARDRTLSDASTTDQNGPRSKEYEGILHILKTERRFNVPLDGLMSHPGYPLVGVLLISSDAVNVFCRFNWVQKNDLN